MIVAWVFIFLNVKHHKTDPTKKSLRSFGSIFILLSISQNHEHTSITKHLLLASLYCWSSLSFVSHLPVGFRFEADGAGEGGRVSKRMTRDWGSDGHGCGDRLSWCSCSVLLLPHGAHAQFSFPMVLMLGSRPSPWCLCSSRRRRKEMGWEKWRAPRKIWCHGSCPHEIL